jgi:hypothetical protein
MTLFYCLALPARLTLHFDGRANANSVTGRFVKKAPNFAKKSPKMEPYYINKTFLPEEITDLNKKIQSSQNLELMYVGEFRAIKKLRPNNLSDIFQKKCAQRQKMSPNPVTLNANLFFGDTLSPFPSSLFVLH